jgi:acetyl-CoA decarbonylase/synthase complex subunit gamma
MAMKALDIYKLLPKSNCKICGYPTCLAFAMKLAAGKVDVDLCPDLDDETKALLGGATRPPIRKIRIGVGEHLVDIGEEFVLYRHEKTFYHQPGLMYRVTDTLPQDEVLAAVDRVHNDMLHRVGEDLGVNGIAFQFESGAVETFGTLIASVEECASLPEVIIAEDPEAQAAALSHCGNFQPLIHAATAANYPEMCALAKQYGCPLVVRAEGTDPLAALTSRCRDEGVEDLVLDPSPSNLREFVHLSTAIRRQAVERTTPDLGYPIYLNIDDRMFTDAALVLGILRYASVIITDPLPLPSLYAALTLRQNIYTDPQKPIQVTPGIYPVNNPGRDGPVLLSVNFSLTFFTLQGYLEASRIPCSLLVVDTEGMSVLTAVAGGKLTESLVAAAIRSSGIEDMVDHRKLVIPGYAAPLSGKIEDETGWKVLVGPRDAAEIGEFLEKEWRE